MRIDPHTGDRPPTSGTPLLDNSRGGPSTVVEGTGQFVGEPATGSVRASGDAGDDGVTLNLVNVPAPQAAKTILGDILAVKYTVDPSIEGKITIQTPKPVTRMAAVDLFQAALRANNAAIVSKGGAYRIVPLDQAPIGASMRVERPAEPDGEVGSGLRVVQLRYVSASEIRRVLEPIALFDVDVMKGMSFALVPVKTSQPDAIASELKTIFAANRQGPMAGMVQFLPNRRLGAILVISPQAQYLRRAAAWVRKLDRQAHGNEKQLFTYAVQNRSAHELVDVLQKMFSDETGGKATGRNVAPSYPEASRQSTAGNGQPGGGPAPGTAGMFRVASAFGGLGGGSAASTRPQGAPASMGSTDSSVAIAAGNGAEPRINESGRVLLDIEQEVSSVVPTTTSGIDSPTIRQRRIRTTVVVNDGDALVLGGLMQKSKNVSRSQFPILGDIPIISNAVKYKDNQIGKTELIVLISPHVIRNFNEARNITDEYRRQIELGALSVRRTRTFLRYLCAIPRWPRISPPVFVTCSLPDPPYALRARPQGAVIPPATA